MLDFILGIYLAGMAVRGWLRGFVRELLDLVGLVVGAAVAFRLSGPMGGFLTDRFGVSPEWARIGAGIALFLLFGATLTIVAHYLSKVMRLPGLSLANRALGAGVAAAWGVLLLLVVLSIAQVLPVPDSVDDAVEGSTVAGAVTDPEGLPRRLVDPLVGDGAMEALAAIERLTGGTRIVPSQGERIETEPVDPGVLRLDEDAAAFVADRVNSDRLEAGSDPLAWSDALAEVAAERALSMYRDGYVERRRPDRVLAQVSGTGLRLHRAAEMTALASSERAAQAAIVEAEDSVLADPRFDRVGVAAVDGPLGVLVVEVFGR
ncbi:MAG: CvpA family protein [Actinomycetota bacterium]